MKIQFPQQTRGPDERTQQLRGDGPAPDSECRLQDRSHRTEPEVFVIDVSLALSMIEAICNELQCLPGDIFFDRCVRRSETFRAERTRLQPFRYGTIRLQVAPGR